MIDLKNKTQDLYSFSDTDLLLEMSWKDDPASVSVAAFDVFYERYKDQVWPIVYEVCKNYTPRHGKQLPTRVFNNTFLMIYTLPLEKMDHLETFTDKNALKKEVKLWMMQLAGEALRELMNGGEEAYRRHIVLKPWYAQTSTADDEGYLVNEENAPYNSDNLTDRPGKTAEEDEKEAEIMHPTPSESDDFSQSDADMQHGKVIFEDVADDSYNADAAYEEEAEDSDYTDAQREAARKALAQLTADQSDILMTMIASEQMGHKRPPDVMKGLETKYQTTSENLRAIKSRALKFLRKTLDVGTKMQI